MLGYEWRKGNVQNVIHRKTWMNGRQSKPTKEHNTMK